MELVLSDNGRMRIPQQFVVVQQRACDCILNGEHADGCRILLEVLKDLLEGCTADQLYLFTLEIQVCRDIVERPYLSLNGNSLHILLLPFFFRLTKIPLSLYVKRDLVSFSIYFVIS